MNIRLKLYISLIILGAGFTYYFSYFWLPKLNIDYIQQNRIHLEKNLLSVAEGIFPLLAEQKLSNIYDNLGNVQKQNPDWIYLRLVNPEGMVLYPLEEKPLPNESDVIQILSQKIYHQDIILGQLDLVYDFTSALSNLKIYLRELQFFILLSVAFFGVLIGLALEYFLLKPMQALSMASKEVADGRFDTPLPKTRKDEVGALIDNFSKMTKELKISRQNIERKVEQRTSQLQASQEQFRFLSEKSPVGILRTDANGCSNYGNEQWIKLVEYSKDQFADYLNWHALIHEREHQETIQLWDRALASGEGFTHEFRLKTFENKIIWVNMQVSPVAGTDTHYRGRVLTFIDITQRKEAEEERDKMEVQLLHAQKMESIGQLAAGIAHEINTPSQYISDNLNFLTEVIEGFDNLITSYDKVIQKIDRDAPERGLKEQVSQFKEDGDIDFLREEAPLSLKHAKDGITRVTKIVSAMKDFSHPGSSEKAKIDLNRSIDSTLMVSRNEWKYVADLETQFDNQCPHVFCFPDEFNQVILNLVVNAAQAIEEKMEEGQKGTIEVGTKALDKEVLIWIKDTGGGIPKDIQSKIFDPFFTTKEVGKGTGQGLSICHSIITEKHEGKLSFTCEEGKSTTFSIHMPMSV
ncbi:MAG: ATP-binding protein [Verrucomicrobiota bacterium]